MSSRPWLATAALMALAVPAAQAGDRTRVQVTISPYWGWSGPGYERYPPRPHYRGYRQGYRDGRYDGALGLGGLGLHGGLPALSIDYVWRDRDRGYRPGPRGGGPPATRRPPRPRLLRPGPPGRGSPWLGSPRPGTSRLGRSGSRSRRSRARTPRSPLKRRRRRPGTCGVAGARPTSTAGTPCRPPGPWRLRCRPPVYRKGVRTRPASPTRLPPARCPRSTNSASASTKSTPG